MGHRFGTRYCLGTHPSDETSPIFFQFIECTFQLISQFPNEFEFGEHMLIFILHGMMSGRFVNFQLDSEKEREGMFGNAGEDMWSLLGEFRGTFLNQNFSPTHAPPLSVDYRISMMRVFSNVWLNPERVII